MKLSGYGITTDLPAGWEGRITQRAAPTGDLGRSTARGTVGEVPRPVVHLANFALPENRGDFGSGAVDVMVPDDIFIALFEYGPESVGKALFATQGIPSLQPRQFNPSGLQRVIPGQAGCQRWFTAAGRAFCLYVVLGRASRAVHLVPAANTTLRATRISSS